jgi:predicted GTPase
MTAVAMTEPTAHATLEGLRLNALKTADGFERLAAILDDEPGLESAATKLRERAVKLREGRFTLLTLGEFKRGKSTLLNAMLGRDLLPRKAAPCTAILTSLRYGTTPAVRVLFTDGRVEKLTPEEFTARYELKVEDVVGGEDAEAAYYQAMTQDRFKDIDMAEVDYPLELCRHGVELVDSPGLAEHAARERRTLEYLKNADAVIMVLDALNFLNQRELAFIRERLNPPGLRTTVFFLINRWNTLTDGLLDPNDPDEAKRVFGEQSQLIELRLKPLCNVRGVDLSARRIFKINALGALRERAKAAPSASVLEETQVPAFERSLARFLAEDRLKARQATDLTHLQDAEGAVADHRRLHEENLDKSLDELKVKYSALQPKLEELRRVGVHIKNALSAMASEVADQMIQSFDKHIEGYVRKPLPAAVEKFDLGRVDSLFVTFDAALDIFRSEGNKFKDGVTAHLQPQIAGYLRPRVLEWIQAVEKTYLPLVARRVEEELRAEAQVYASILGEVGQSIGGHLKDVSIEDILKKWLKDFGGPNAAMVDVGMDLAPLMAGIVADVAAELTLHMSAHVFPGVGVIISAILLLWRRNRMRANVRRQILEGMSNKLTDFTLIQHEAIRSALRDGFAKLENAIGGKIQDQIAQIDDDMRSLIEQKEGLEADASTRRQQLAELQARLDQEARTITSLLGA